MLTIHNTHNKAHINYNCHFFFRSRMAKIFWGCIDVPPNRLCFQCDLWTWCVDALLWRQLNIRSNHGHILSDNTSRTECTLHPAELCWALKGISITESFVLTVSTPLFIPSLLCQQSASHPYKTMQASCEIQDGCLKCTVTLIRQMYVVELWRVADVFFYIIILFTSSDMSPTQTGELRAHLATQRENTTVVLSLFLSISLSIFFHARVRGLTYFMHGLLIHFDFLHPLFCTAVFL